MSSGLTRYTVSWGFTVAVCALYLFVLHPGYFEYLVSSLFDTYRFNDDVRIYLPSFYRYTSQSVFEDDYIYRYLHIITPIGMKGVYLALLQFVSLYTASTLLTLTLFIATIIFSFLATKEYTSSTFSGLISVTMILLSGYVFSRINGGLPRSFAFPFVAYAMWLTARNKYSTLAYTSFFASLFYPVVGLIIGGVSVLYASFGYWKNRKRWRHLGIIVLVSAIPLGITLVQLEDYGKRLTSTDSELFPEIGAHGRYGIEDRSYELSHIMTDLSRTIRYSLTSHRTEAFDRLLPEQALVAVILIFVFLSLFSLSKISENDLHNMIKACHLLLAAVLCYVLSSIFNPYLYIPQRYLIYVLPICLPILIVSLTSIVGKNLYNIPNISLRIPAVVLFTLSSIFIFCSFLFPGSDTKDLYIDERKNALLYEAVAKLPEETILAGWPGGPIESISYLTKRRAFLTFETHQVLHKIYTKRMRERMNALIAAYFATDKKEVERLASQYGVTHLLVDRRHYREASPSTYFAPFNQTIFQAYRRRSTSIKPLILLSGKYKIVYEYGDYLLIEIEEPALRVGSSIPGEKSR